jgi:cytoskeleton protein RodZ
MSENKPLADRSVGAYLRQAREEKNLSYEQVSKGTKIHGNVLKAMETDDFKVLGGVYARSFLRIYADYLGLDKEDMIQRYEQATGSAAPKRIIFPGEPKAAASTSSGVDWLGAGVSWLKKVPWKWVLIVIVGYFILAGTVKHFKSRKRAAPPAAKIQVKAPPVKNDIASIASAPVAAPVAKSMPAPEKAAEPKPVAAKPKEKIVLVMKAKERVWAQVKVDGKVAFQNVLAKGTAESWQAQERIDLSIANAGAVQLELNGKLIEKIGRRGQALKNVVVTRSGLSVKR